jgi:tetraacyldisaccharide 4'-kinase
MQREIIVSAAHVSPVVFCAIARPKQFFSQVHATGITPAAEIEFRDHHRYDNKDIKRLQATRAKFSAGGFLTTEKDAANLGSLQAELSPLAIAALKLTLKQPDDVVKAILKSTISPF